MDAPDIAMLAADGRHIAYRLRPANRLRAGAPTLVFLPGYGSDMDGAKASAIDAFAARRGIGCLRLDYSGTGASPGNFAEGTMDRWIADAAAAVDALTDGPLILAGSSMGGWIALHLALIRRERVNGLLGIAAAPDFTDWGFGASARAALAADGAIGPQSHRIHLGLWQSGQQLRLLESEIALDCPVRLVHGEKDRDVPLEIAFRLIRALRSADVQLSVIKGGGHRLSEPREIDAILHTLAGLLEQSE